LELSNSLYVEVDGSLVFVIVDDIFVTT